MSKLQGKVVVITGGARGIGAACATELVRRGAKVAILDRDGVAAKATADALGPQASAFTVDVTDREGLRATFAAVADEHGGVDIAIANAGISGPVGPVAQSDPDALARVIEIDLIGVMETIQAALPFVMERRGYVLAVASAAAVIPTPTIAAYGAAKAGVDAFMRALRIELKPHGTAAGAAYFGLIETELIYGSMAEPGIELLLGGIPGRLGRPLPAARAAEVIVRGIERRKAHVYAPSWVRTAAALRGQLSVLDRFVGRITPVAALIGSSSQHATRKAH